MSWDSFRLAIRQFYTNRPQSIVYKEAIEVSPGNITIGRGQEVLIEVLNPETRLEHKLYFRYDKMFRELALTDWRYLFNSVETDIEYYISNSVASSDTFKITCLDEPYARQWRTQISPPAYTGLSTVVDTLSQGNIEAFLHSLVNLNIQTNIPIKQAQMRFSDGRTLPLKGNGNSFSTQFRVQKAETWYLELTDFLSRKNRPEEKSINIITDSPPEIRILFPAKDTVLDQRMNLPLIVSANDDFGLRNLQLVYQINDAAVQNITIKSVIAGKILNLTTSLTWRLWPIPWRQSNLLDADLGQLTYAPEGRKRPLRGTIPPSLRFIRRSSKRKTSRPASCRAPWNRLKTCNRSLSKNAATTQRPTNRLGRQKAAPRPDGKAGRAGGSGG